VYEVTPVGRVPIPDVAVYCELCGMETHSWAYTDANGLPTRLLVRQDGFADPPGLSNPGWREVRIDGDTRFDIELVRR
jgi:hypothetical protein